MTIFFSGHSFKYELEGLCKLFLPLMRFKHEYEKIVIEDDENFIITRRRKGQKRTLLWVSVSVDGEKRRKSTALSNDDEQYESECERLLGILLYSALSQITGIAPRWGILTGVRPVNILQKLRKQGKTDDEITRFFKEKYLVSDEKLKLAFLTANAQSPCLESYKSNSYSLYVAIPFCVSRCSYCSFVSHSIDRPKATDRIDDYLSLLCAELEKTAVVAQKSGLSLDCIYIGGGTPTALSAPQLERVTGAIAKYFDVKSASEYTIEAGRADTITKEKLAVIKRAGADRISVNPQTFNDDTLKAIGRKHTAKQAEDAYYEARETGFYSINMDFIAGLPGDTLESFKATVDKAIELAPENITVHTLSIKRSADLFSEEGMAEYAKSGITIKMTAYAEEKLIKAGYSPYYLYRQKNTIGNLENVGYSKKGYESRYNIYIMDEMQTILACGAGGVTKLVTGGASPISRIFNYKYHFEYIDGFDEILKRKEEALKCLTAHAQSIQE